MKPVASTASLLLGAVSLAHLLRIVLRVQVTLADRIVPIWVSWVAFLVAGGISVMLWREARNQR